MAEQRKITDLVPANTPTGAELLECVQGGVNTQITLDAIRGATRYEPLIGSLIDFASSINYTINLTSDLSINVANATTGQLRVINTTQTGAFELKLPVGHKKMGGWDIVTPTISNVISYTVLFDGVRYLWTRAAYED